MTMCEPETYAWARITRCPTVPGVVLHLSERSRPASLLCGIDFKRPVHIAVLHDRLCRSRHASRERPKQRRVKRAPARQGRRTRIPHACGLFCESDGNCARPATHSARTRHRAAYLHWRRRPSARGLEEQRRGQDQASKSSSHSRATAPAGAHGRAVTNAARSQEGGERHAAPMAAAPIDQQRY